MGKYKRLAINTMIFAIASFSSKLLSFLMLPLYTNILSTEDYGVVDIVLQTCNLLIPLASVGIINAIIRFGLEKTADKKSVLTIGCITLMGGFAVLLLFAPLLAKVQVLTAYVPYMYLLILMSCAHGLFSQFARAIGYVKFYAVDGVLSTVLTIGLNVLFLAVLDMGIEGYLLATILTDMLCAVLDFLFVRMYRFLRIKRVTRALWISMLAYCIPLIPNTICTWIMSISSRYILLGNFGESETGIFAVANKIPTILMIVANIFSEAWQISAVTEEEGREAFFTRICSLYQALAFTVASGLILFSQLAVRILAAPDYYSAWRYIPPLVIGTTFGCIATFLASIYMINRKSVYTLMTTAIAAMLNIALGICFVKVFGAIGVAYATATSYFVQFAIRAVHTRAIVKISWNIPRLLANVILLLVQTIVMLLQFKGYLLVSAVLLLAVFVLNVKDVLVLVRQKVKKG